MENLQEPPIKKIKIENLDMYVEKLKQCKNLKAVLGDEFEHTLPQVKVTVGHLKTRKEISKAILLLNERVPLKQLSHLKRARGRDILLCPTSHLNGSSIQKFIELNISDLKDSFEYFKEIDVIAIAPKVKKQIVGTQTWSLNFHPNKYLESLVSDNFFTKYQMNFHISYMTMVFEVIKWHLKNEISPDFFNKVNATVVVDPLISTIVAVSFCNKNHPIQHSTMLAIDNVAKTQNGGTWGGNTIDSVNCTVSGINSDLQSHLKQEFRNISFGARVFKSKRAIEICEGDDDISESPYLCTGYHIYNLREPCIMCSMALVHARAKRIFYCFDNPQNGGLKSRVKLQTVQSLNHHFEVFTGFLENN